MHQDSCSECFSGFFFMMKNRNLISLCALHLFQLPFPLKCGLLIAKFSFLTSSSLNLKQCYSQPEICQRILLMLWFADNCLLAWKMVGFIKCSVHELTHLIKLSLRCDVHILILLVPCRSLFKMKIALN